MDIISAIKENLHNKIITGKDNRQYIIEVAGDTTFTIYVFDKENRMRYGCMPRIIYKESENQIIRSGISDFTQVSGLGLYKKTMQLFSDALSPGVMVITSIERFADKESVIRLLKKSNTNLSEIEILRDTLVGSVFLFSGFSEIFLTIRGQYGKLLSIKKLIKNLEFHKINVSDLQLTIKAIK